MLPSSSVQAASTACCAGGSGGGPGPDPNEQHDLDDAGVPEEFLHPCCQKDREEARVYNRVMTKLRAADRTRHALERRTQAIATAPLLPQHRHVHGSGCCELMADYPALARLRQKRGILPPTGVQEEEQAAPLPSRRGEASESEEEEDSDDELLRELEEEEGGFLEIRRAEMMRRAQEAAELRHLGVGMHTEVPPERVLRLAHLRCPGLVAHLYHPESPLSAALDVCLEGLAGAYPGTRFVRTSRSGPGAQAVVDRLRVPASAGEGSKACLVALRDGCPVDALGDGNYGRRFGDGAEEVYPDALEQWLRHCHVLLAQAPEVGKLRQLLGVPAAGAGRQQQTSGSVRRGGVGDEDEDREDEEEEEEEPSYYDCGLAGCHKAFAHSHVGLEGVDLPREFGSAAAAAEEAATTTTE